MRIRQTNLASLVILLYFRLFLHYLLRYLDDAFANVVPLLSANLEPLYMIFLQELQMLLWYLRDVALVALVDEAKDAILGRVLFGLLHPVANHVVERFGVGGIIYQDDCIGPLVVRFCYAPKPFLARRVPNLQLHVAILDVHRPISQQAYLNLKSIPIVEM